MSGPVFAQLKQESQTVIRRYQTGKTPISAKELGAAALSWVLTASPPDFAKLNQNGSGADLAVNRLG
jgi:hypothetical protein